MEKSGRDAVKELYMQGKTDKEIVEATGLSPSTVAKYTYDILDVPEHPVEGKKTSHLSADFIQSFNADWTRTVNRIRKYYGMPLFEVPKD